MHVFYASSANISGETKTIYIFDKEFLESLVMESGPKELSYLQPLQKSICYRNTNKHIGL